MRAAHTTEAQHLFLGVSGDNVVAHRTFGEQQKLGGVARFDAADQGGGAAGKIRLGNHFRAALRVGQNFNQGELRPYCFDILHGEFFMYFTMTRPADKIERAIFVKLDAAAVCAIGTIMCAVLFGLRFDLRHDDPLARLGSDIARQIFIGDKDDGVAVERFNHRHSIARGAADITFSLDIGIGVDIGHHGDTGEFLLEGAHIGGGNAAGQRTAGVRGGEQHRLLWVENLGGFGHKLDATEDDDRLLGLRGHPAQRQRIADKIGNRVKERRLHIVMAQDDRILLNFQPIDFID